MRRLLPTTATAAVLALSACGGASTPASTVVTVTTTGPLPAPETSTADAGSASSGSQGSSASSASAPSSQAPSDGAGTPSAPASSAGAASTQAAGGAGSCSALAGSLTREQKVGQLLMVGLDAGSPATADDETITVHDVGSVIYLGGWQERGRVADTSAHLQQIATPSTRAGLRRIVAADQEGGQVQQLRGLTQLPSALEQGQGDEASITENGRRIGTELREVGVNLDLAPVADVVPESLGRANGPIGRWGRQFGYDPETATRGVSAFTKGLREARVGATVKHFPGIGRIHGNTDFSATGITDEQTSPDDDYLTSFRAGWQAGAIVMVSSARYARIDPSSPAVFSRTIVTDLLRGRLGYQGVTITDDMGHAKAVAAVPVGERAVRFVDAGGDIVLTGAPSDVKKMSSALLAKADDADFAAKIDAAAARVVAYKATLGLADCH